MGEAHQLTILSHTVYAGVQKTDTGHERVVRIKDRKTRRKVFVVDWGIRRPVPTESMRHTAGGDLVRVTAL